MKDFKGTKGEWHYDKYEQIIKSRQHLRTEYICEMLDCDDDSEIAPNAQLIAAAPELLQKLQQLTYIIRQRGFAGNFSEYLKSSDTIINKALGKEDSNE